MESLTAGFQLLIGAACLGGGLVWFALGAAFFLSELWQQIFGRIDAGRFREE